MLCRAGVLGLLLSWLWPLSVWVQLSRLPVLEWPAVIGVEGSTGEGDDEIDSVLRESVRNSGPSRTPAGAQVLSLLALPPDLLKTFTPRKTVYFNSDHMLPQ